MTVVDPVTPVVTPPIKPAWLSKTNAAGVILTIIGIATYFTDPAHTPGMTLSSVSEAVGGVAVIIFRTWFTNQPVTQFSLNRLRDKMLRR